MKPIFRGSVSKGNLVMGQDYIDYLFTLEGQDVDVEIYKHKTKRSIQQNKLYFAMLKIISENTGHSKDELHEFFKQKFLGDKIEVFGEPFICSRSTTKLTTETFSTFLGDIRFFIMEAAGIDLPIE